MKQILSGTTLAAALLLAPQLGVAQTAPQPGNAAGQATAIPPLAMNQLQQAEQSLSQALRQMAATSGTQQSQAAQGVRQALTQLQQALGQVPAERRSSQNYKALETRVGEAQAALQGDRPDLARARTAVDAVVIAIPVLVAEVGGTAGAAGAQVVVRQTADQIQVQQGAPQVTVQQAQPEILVVIPQPEIIIRQPPAQVTVRMPKPQVAVQQAQPQVRVVEAQPQVQVVPSQQQAQVRVNSAEPRVTVQQQEGQPQIRYEQTGPAQVKVEQQGQQMAAAGAAAGAAATGAAAQPATPAAAGLPLQRVTSLIGTNVVGANGRDAGEVENFLLDRSGNVRAAVVEWGGFLGIGERRAVVPIEQIKFGAPNERARLDMTREQLEQLGGFDRNNLGQYGTRYGWGDGVRLYR